MLSIKRIYMIFMARNREFYRDKGALGWTLLFPILVVWSFGHLFNLDKTDYFKLALVGEVQRPFEIPNTQKLKLTNIEEAKDKLRLHKVDGILENNNDQFIVWLNKSSPKSAVLEDLLYFHLQGEKKPSALETKRLEAKEILYVEWLFPGLVAMNVMWMALWGVGWVIVRQRKLGILKRFNASPIRPYEYLLAQMLSRLLILWLCGLIIVTGSYMIFPFGMKGSFFDFFVAYTIGSLALCGIGLMFAIRSTSDELISGALNLVSFPMMFLSEIWFSLEGSPEWVLFLARCMPLYHFSHSLRLIQNEGAGLIDVQSHLMINLIIAIVGIVLGSLLFRWNAKN
jgi:ABC-type multidrug transport system permease subunit